MWTVCFCAYVMAQAPVPPAATETAPPPVKTVAFQMRDKPWNDVLEWLAAETGFPVITTARPTGTFSFIGDPKRRLTIPEVIDILNEALLNQKYVLIRREASFTLVPADVKIDPAVLPRLSVEELQTRGNTEVASVVLQLASLVAEDLVPEVQKMMGPFGEVSALSKANQLVMQDTVKNLKRIIETLRAIENNEKGQAESFSHVCKYIKAREAERILKELLGDPNAVLRTLAQAMQAPARDGRPPAPVPPPVKLRMFYIAADDRTNTVLVTGPADKIAQAREIVARIDVPQAGQQPIALGPPVLRNYATPPGTAETVAKTLQDVYKNSPTVRVAAVGGNSIMVFAGPEDHFEIARMVQGHGDAGGGLTTELLPLTALEAEKVTATLKGMFVDGRAGQGPYVEADTTRNAVIVRGTAEQVAEVKAALKAIGEAGGAASGSLRVINLDRGSASAVARELERILSQTRKNPVKVITPSESPPRDDVRPPVPPVPNGGGGDPPALIDPQNRPTAGSDRPINITAVGNKLIITSDDPAALALAQELVRLLTTDAGGEGDFEVIRLKHANAADAAKTLDEAFNGPRGGQQPAGQGGLPGGFPFPFGGFGRGERSSTPAPANGGRVRVVADPASNSLLVKAPPIDMLTIRRLLRESIDAGIEPQSQSRTFVIGPLQHANANDVADVIRDVYRDAINSNAAPAPQPGGFPFPFGGRGTTPPARLTDAAGNPRSAALSVGVDERTNSLVVQCSEALHRDIERLVQQLEEASKNKTRVVKVLPIKGIDPALIRQAIEALQTDGNRPANTDGGPGGFSPFGFGGFGGDRGGSSGRSGSGRSGRSSDRRRGDAGPQLVDPQIRLASAVTVAQAPAEAEGEIRGPRGPVSVEALDELGVIVIGADSAADLEEVLKVIEYITRLGAGAEVQAQVVPLRHADALSLSNTLNQIFSRLQVGTNANTAVRIDPATQQSRTRFQSQFFREVDAPAQAVGSLAIIPLPRFNSLLVVAPKARIPDVIQEIEKLDQPSTANGRATAFPLKKANAARVEALITNFYATRYPNEQDGGNLVRVTRDDSTNTVFVQAGPDDLQQIRELIERIDSTVSSAVNELRLIRLKNTVADELSALITQAINQSIATATAAPVASALPGGFGSGFRSGAPQQTGPAGAGGNRATTLRFFMRPGPGGTIESGFLEDIRIVPDVRSNTLIVSAPAGALDLIYALVAELDVTSAARAVIKVFTLKKADAQQTALLIQQLFGGAGLARAPAVGGAAGAAQPGPGAAAIGGGARPLLSLTGEPGEGASLIELRVSVDDRTNSVIVAGSGNDLEVIEAVVSRLEESDVQGRHSEVYRLKNATAADVANALTQFLAQSLQVYQLGQQLTAFQEVQRNVVIVPEPISNSLVISATPNYYAEVMKLIHQIDTMPPQVVIQVLVAEVTLNDSQEFGVEIGLQSPVLFQRSIIPGTASFASAQGGLVPPGVTVNSTLPGVAVPGFNFNTTSPLGNNFTVQPQVVGFQGLGNLGTGRVSPTQNIGGLVFSAASDTFSLLIRALRVQGRIDVLSRPQVMTLDNQTAAVNIGQDIPIVTNTVVNAQGFAQNNIDRRNVGVLLRVTPRITPDGQVLMRVFPEISSVVPQPVQLGNGQLGTALNVQQVETTVVAQDGETVVIGGLIANRETLQENKIPWLGDLPYVGAAFRYRTTTRERRELLIILTPHIVRHPGDAERILAQEARRIDWCLGQVARVHGPGGLDAVLGGPVIESESPLPAIGLPTQSSPLQPGMFAPTMSQPGPQHQVPSSSPAPTPLPPPTPVSQGPVTLPTRYSEEKSAGKEPRGWKIFNRD